MGLFIVFVRAFFFFLFCWGCRESIKAYFGVGEHRFCSSVIICVFYFFLCVYVYVLGVPESVSSVCLGKGPESLVDIESLLAS